MRGDLLFWTSDGSLASRLIALATRGPYVHISVDMGDGHDIGSHSEGGVQLRRVPDDRGIDKVSVAPLILDSLGGTLEEASRDIERGIAFLVGEVGNAYGWCNIINSVLKVFHLPYRLTRLDRYDCSSLVTRYLVLCGVTMGDLGEEPDSVSPNDLARRVGLLRHAHAHRPPPNHPSS